MKPIDVLKGMVKSCLRKYLDRQYTLSTIHNFSNILKVKDLIMYPPVSDGLPSESGTVVLSPHFDDDVIGCGGTLALHLRAGGEARVIYLTDGRAGDPEFRDLEALERTRKEEAGNALRVLGFTANENLEFLDFPETRVVPNEESCGRLREALLRGFGASPSPVLMIPSFLDGHRDHVAVNVMLKLIATSLPPATVVYACEVWTPVAVNCLVDITAVADLKREALGCYATQLKYVDYERVAMSLNAYRTAMTMKGRGYAEAFLKLPLQQYCTLY